MLTQIKFIFSCFRIIISIFAGVRFKKEITTKKHDLTDTIWIDIRPIPKENNASKDASLEGEIIALWRGGALNTTIGQGMQNVKFCRCIYLLQQNMSGCSSVETTVKLRSLFVIKYRHA